MSLHPAPHGAQGYYRAGLAFSKLGKNAEALEHYKRAVALEPTCVTKECICSCRHGLMFSVEGSKQLAAGVCSHTQHAVAPGSVRSSSGSRPRRAIRCQQTLVLTDNHLSFLFRLEPNARRRQRPEPTPCVLCRRSGVQGARQRSVQEWEIRRRDQMCDGGRSSHLHTSARLSLLRRTETAHASARRCRVHEGAGALCKGAARRRRRGRRGGAGDFAHKPSRVPPTEGAARLPTEGGPKAVLPSSSLHLAGRHVLAL